jgi:hypothetical protein
LDDEDRPVRVSGSYSRPFLSAALVVVVACVAAFAFLPEFGDYAKGSVFALGDAVGIRPPEDEYSAAYKRLGISPLPAKLRLLKFPPAWLRARTLRQGRYLSVWRGAPCRT